MTDFEIGVGCDRVIDGVCYIRSYVSEVQVGDENPFGEIVTDVQPIEHGGTRIYFGEYTSVYRNQSSTMLVVKRDTDED